MIVTVGVSSIRVPVVSRTATPRAGEMREPETNTSMSEKNAPLISRPVAEVGLPALPVTDNWPEVEIEEPVWNKTPLAEEPLVTAL